MTPQARRIALIGAAAAIILGFAVTMGVFS